MASKPKSFFIEVIQNLAAGKRVSVLLLMTYIYGGCAEFNEAAGIKDKVGSPRAKSRERQSLTRRSRNYGTSKTLITNCFMSLRPPVEDEMQISVMPAWIAGIQVRRMRLGRHPCQPAFQHCMLE
jgi:hypothetical protein